MNLRVVLLANSKLMKEDLINYEKSITLRMEGDFCI